MNLSVIIPIYNEEKTITACLTSLAQQTVPFELIVVDDGSTDKTLSVLSKFQISNFKFQIIQEKHQGPGAARNLGAKNAHGDILVFVDSDMTFAHDFLEKLTKPIEKGETRGTFTKAEFVINWDNIWARCWNHNQNIHSDRRIPPDYPETAPVFRAILSSEFARVGGFTAGVGWTDDWTLSRKLKYQSTATFAKCYHANPSTLYEVFTQAKWVGKNEFLTKSPKWIVFNFLRYSIFFSCIYGLFGVVAYGMLEYLVFKFVYDLGVVAGLTESILGQHKNK